MAGLSPADKQKLDEAYATGDEKKIQQARQQVSMSYIPMNEGYGGPDSTAQARQELAAYKGPATPAAPKTPAAPATPAVPAGTASGEGYGGTTQVSSQIKYDAEGRPIRNDYQSVLDKDGNLNKQYSLADKIGPDIKLNTQGADAIRDRALSTGPSAWAQLAKEQQGVEQAGAMDNAQRSTAQGVNSAYQNLRSRGGMSAGQRERLALQGARAQGSATQNVQRQGMLDRGNIMMQDQQAKDNMLMQMPGIDMNQANFAQNQRAFNTNAQQFDIGNKLKDMGGLNAYNDSAYQQAGLIYGAEKTAEAQARSGGGGGGGCCFIFLEARYGNGTMDKVVRRYRDEHMNSRNQRGYYKLSEVLVPMMRKYKLVKFATRVMMTDPMVAYGKAHYGEGSRLGFIFKPVVNFWLKTFTYLGGHHDFIRENGETI